MPQLPLDFPPGLGYSEQYARKERTRHDLPRIQSQIRPHPRSPAGGGHPPAEGPTLLLAVPGSGKTTTLVTRLGYLIHCLGVEPGRILTVTYTVAAAGDMKRRFAALFGEEHAGALAFRTINGASASPSSPTTPGPRGRSPSSCGRTRGS